MNSKKLNLQTLKYYLFGRNKYYSDNTSTISIKNSIIKKSNLHITGNSKVETGQHCKIINSKIHINNGKLILGNNTSLINASIIINNGDLIIGNNSRIMCKIWVRYNGKIQIGNYSNINLNSELRADDSIVIGDFTQISYNVSIWDTNTHCIYSPKKRRELSQTIGIGNEIEKPITKAIQIGSDCWIGKNSAIMKGCSIGNNVIIGYGTTLVNKKIDNNLIVVPQIELKFKSNNNIL